ncbi:MAG: chromosomal replication initiator DnaA [Rhodobacteraceae bacterium]|nr:MAG: chromosomal replication initiator DnaA [Paracoccaceae bacterium]
MIDPAQRPLALALPRRRALGRSDFIETAANADAAALIAARAGWPEGRLALIGPEGAGKTHLAHVFAAETDAPIVPALGLREADAPRLVAAGAVAVEDVDRLGADAAAETALFHLLNLAAAEGAVLLATGRAAPTRWPIRLPDLASRLSAMTVARLLPPDDALLAAVIAKNLEERGLNYEAGTPAFLAARIERSFSAAEDAVARLDALSLASGRRITRKLAGEMLG